jgi:hypothetical protein
MWGEGSVPVIVFHIARECCVWVLRNKAIPKTTMVELMFAVVGAKLGLLLPDVNTVRE